MLPKTKRMLVSTPQMSRYHALDRKKLLLHAMGRLQRKLRVHFG